MGVLEWLSRHTSTGKRTSVTSLEIWKKKILRIHSYRWCYVVPVITNLGNADESISYFKKKEGLRDFETRVVWLLLFFPPVSFEEILGEHCTVLHLVLGWSESLPLNCLFIKILWKEMREHPSSLPSLFNNGGYLMVLYSLWNKHIYEGMAWKLNGG